MGRGEARRGRPACRPTVLLGLCVSRAGGQSVDVRDLIRVCRGPVVAAPGGRPAGARVDSDVERGKYQPTSDVQRLRNAPSPAAAAAAVMRGDTDASVRRQSPRLVHEYRVSSAASRAQRCVQQATQSHQKHTAMSSLAMLSLSLSSLSLFLSLCVCVCVCVCRTTEKLVGGMRFTEFSFS